MEHDPNFSGASTTNITLPTVFDGGKVYLIVESTSGSSPDLFSGGTGEGNTGAIQNESDLGWSAAQQYDFAYDSFEFTLNGTGSGAQSDVGNLTEITAFGLPMQLDVLYSSGATSATAGYVVSGGEIANDIRSVSSGAVTSFTTGPLSGGFRMASSPSTSSGGTGPFTSADWGDYVSSLGSGGYVDSQPVILTGEFNGAKDAQGNWHNGGIYAYQLSFVSGGLNGGTFLLKPLSGSQIHEIIAISEQDLEESIYATLGSATIYTNVTFPSSGGVTGTTLSGAEAIAAGLSPTDGMMGVGSNNQWGKVLNELVTGLDGGFIKNTGVSSNTHVSAGIDLDENYNWDPSYAYTSISSVVSGGYQTFDRYAQIIGRNTNAYGFGYQDNLFQSYISGGNLQIPLYDSSTGGDVSSITLTVFSDNDPTSGYRKPVINNFLSGALVSGAYAPATVISGANVGLDFATAAGNNVGVLPASNDIVTFSFITSGGSTPVWSTVTLDGSSGGILGLWQLWNIVPATGGGYQANLSGIAQAPGNINITGFSNSISWYQVGISSSGGSPGKLFNLYATTNSGGDFVFSGGSIAIDGLATILPPAGASSANTFNIDFNGNFDPTLFVPNDVNSFTSPALKTILDAPVAGVANGDFVALPNQDFPYTNVINTTTAAISGGGGLEFAWTGSNNNSNTSNSNLNISSWVNGITNLIDANTVARIEITSSGHVVEYVTATADINGAWQTSGAEVVNLGVGTYSATMTEYTPSQAASGFVNAMTLPSQPLILTVWGTVNSVASGATSSGAVVSGGTMLEVLSGGTADVARVLSGAMLQVDTGASASGSIINSGGSETIYGSDVSAIVSGGYVAVDVGGSASDFTVSSLGTLFVSTGGVVVNPTISSGGALILQSGAVVSGAIDFAGTGGDELVIIGISSLAGTYISGMSAGDTIDLIGFPYSGGISNAVLSGGNVLDVIGPQGATTQSLTVPLDPAQNFTGFTFNTAQDASGSGTLVTEVAGSPPIMTTQFVSSGVVSSGVIVTGFNILEILSGGTANATSVTSSGTVQVDFGGLASATILSGSLATEIVSGTDISGIVSSGGTLNVFGSASNATVFSGGVEHVSSGGSVANQVLSGGQEFVSFNAADSGTEVSSGGTLTVENLGFAQSTVVNSGGTEVLVAGGLGVGALANPGGSIIVSSGGQLDLVGGDALGAAGVTVLSGGVLVRAPDTRSPDIQ